MSDAPSDVPNEEPVELPASLKFLKLLVTVLTGVMILGVVVIIYLLVTQLTRLPDPMVLPEMISLPEGQSATAFTRGTDWFAVVTEGETGEAILIYDLGSGELRRNIPVE